MTPEKIEEVAAIDQKVADAFVKLDNAYLELKEAVEAYDTFIKVLQTS